MTCIVGVKSKNKIFMGCDSMTSSHYDINIMVKDDAKIFKINNNMLIGFSGLHRTGQIIRNNLIVEPQVDGVNDFKFICTNVVEKIRSILKEFESGTEFNNNKPDDSSGVILIGHNKKLYKIDCAYGVSETLDTYRAIGSGGDVSLGSLYATMNTGLSAKKRIKTALKAATHHTAHVKPPYLIFSV